MLLPMLGWVIPPHIIKATPHSCAQRLAQPGWRPTQAAFPVTLDPVKLMVEISYQRIKQEGILSSPGLYHTLRLESLPYT